MTSKCFFQFPFVIFVFACQSAKSTETTLEWLNPTETGPHAVGVLETNHIGSDGIEKNALIWYPTTETDGDRIRYSDLILSDVSQIDVTANCDDTRPVVLFSHANTSINWQSTFLVEHLASQGYVVMAPMHHGNNFFDDDREKIEVAKQRPIEIQDAADWLFDSQTESDAPLSNCIDPTHGYAVMGHSFGGYTTLALAGAPANFDAGATYCANDSDYFCDVLNEWIDEGGDLGVVDGGDPRVWAAVSMVHHGYEVFHSGLNEIKVPTLLLGASEDIPTLEKMHFTFDGLSAAYTLYGHLGCRTFSYSDICDLGITASRFNCDEQA